MKKDAVIGVAQGKRVIAKAVAVHPEIQRAMDSGKIAICAGTTNSYILEELLGEKIQPFSFTTGLTLLNQKPNISSDLERSTVVLFDHGKPDFSRNAGDLVAELGIGDIFIKGCNALNYEQDVAGLLIGHPTGGTIGATIGTLISKKIRIMIPAGLEKCIPFDLIEIARDQFEDTDTQAHSIFPFTGEIITEIEALEILTDIEAVQIAAGGILGAQGAVWLMLEGSKEQIDKALDIINNTKDEPPFGC